MLTDVFAVLPTRHVAQTSVPLAGFTPITSHGLYFMLFKLVLKENIFEVLV